jgi:hypothetical protein
MRSFINAITLTNGTFGRQDRTDGMGMIQLRNLAAGVPGVYCGRSTDRRSCSDSLRSCQPSSWREAKRCRTARHCSAKRHPSTCLTRPGRRLGSEVRA